MLRFFDFLFPPRQDEITLRAVSDDGFLARTNPQLVPHTEPATIALFSFSDDVVRAAIHEAKYHGSSHAFRLLALALSEYLRDADDLGRGTLYIVPIPLGEKRKKERGLNQIEEVVRRSLSGGSSTFSLETDLLRRTRETASQVTLPRTERKENMRGAFSAIFPANPAHTYIVIDDVITTGATLQAAIDALRDAGAHHIVPLALAH
ncbi:MAG: hypothetical protein WC790_02535 [Candidatus Paceibacterota bacterium]|jgi:ComF family protein